MSWFSPLFAKRLAVILPEYFDNCSLKCDLLIFFLISFRDLSRKFYLTLIVLSVIIYVVFGNNNNNNNKHARQFNFLQYVPCRVAQSV